MLFKKSAIMVLGSEPVLGWGCEAEDEVTAQEVLKMNFRGNSLKTRILYTVMPKTLYKDDDTPLRKVIAEWAADLEMCFTQGLQLPGQKPKLRVAAIGLKADWPALASLGNLQRNFRRESFPHGAGVCHLCMGNTAHCPTWHEVDFSSAPWVRTMETADLPWKPDNESSLTARIPMDPGRKPNFYLVDLFHTVLKGVHADLAGSAIASWQIS